LAVDELGGGRSGDGDLRREYAPKYQKAIDCLLKARDAPLTFFDLPAEHWTHLRHVSMMY